MIFLSACRRIFFFNDPATTEIYTLSLHDALPSCSARPHACSGPPPPNGTSTQSRGFRSEEHTSELQSLRHLVCRLLLEKKKNTTSAPFGPLHQLNPMTSTPAHSSASITSIKTYPP